MTTFIFANNVNTTLAGAVSTSATTITLASTSNLPASIPSGSVFVITLNDAATRGNYEVVYATAISGATLTVLRAQEGTSALAWLVGDYAYDGPTAGQQGSFGQVGGNNTWTGNNSFNNPVVVGAATASGDAVNLGQFPSSLSNNGWKKVPDPNSPSGYFIEQWGGVTLGNGSGQVVTLPIAFPNAFLSCTCSYGSAPGAGSACGADPGTTLSTIRIGNATSSTNQIYYRAVGY